MNYVLGLLVLCFCFTLAAGAAASTVNLVPKPKSAVFTDAPPVMVEAGSTAIVLGKDVVESELAAAELLQKTVRRRFKQDWPVLRETDKLPARGAIVLLGQRKTNSMLDRLCRSWNVQLSEKLPGFDGYIIRFGEDDGRTIVLVGGTSGRAVIYGQDTLFQLITQQNGKVVLNRAEINDWPTVPWRGRPQSNNTLHLRPGTMDSYAHARMNYIDLRESPEKRRGQYGYIPGHPVDVEVASTVIKAAHRQGMFVYGNVLCAVSKDKYDDAIKTFEELIKLGADGLWISIDDPGAPNRWGMTHDLMARVMELGRKHNMTGTDIAVIPGRYNSKNPGTSDNLKAMEIPGMRESLYFSTLTPTPEVLKDYQATMGLKTRLAWWHNWPRPEGGLTHGAYGGVTFRKNDKPAYLELPPLKLGWNEPSYEELRRAGECLDAVQPFGGGGWGSEYTANVVGWWAWDPGGHEWEALQRRVYDVVFGPGQIEAAKRFDEMMPSLRSFFMVPEKDTKPESPWPPRLKNTGDREKVETLAAEMETVLRNIRHGAPGESLLEPDVLETWYLEPMEAQIKAARIMAALPYPEYWWDTHKARMMLAVQSGNLEQAQQWNEEARQRVQHEVREVTSALSDMQGMDSYESYWLGRFDMPRIPFVQRTPKFSGDLSDPAWKQAAVIDGITSVAYGSMPKDRTEVRLMYSADALYVGFTCFESDMDKLTAAHTERDSDIWRDDSVEVFLNPGAMGTPYYQFVTNSVGAVSDGRRLPGQSTDSGWSGKWEVKTTRGSDHWTAEFRIPFTDLGVKNAAGAIWQANFVRNDHAGTLKDAIPDLPTHLSAWGPSRDLHDSSKFRPFCFEPRKVE